ncbi:MAG TPA: ABC transporter permease [bacterium]|nr:ABC transporter permease [bacterium]HQL61524.1 ABC transporter permease [bacterium]
MGNTWAIFKREMRAYFISPMAYALYVIFLLLSGYFFTVGISYYAHYSVMAMQAQQYGGLPPFTETVFRNLFGDVSIVLLLMVPLLTMRLFAEEKKMGTMELLLTYPIRDIEVVLGKFFAALAVIGLMLVLTFTYPLLAQYVAGDQMEYGVALSGYLGLFLEMAAFIAVGIFLSSTTENQIVAGVISFGALLLIWAVGWGEELVSGAIGKILAQLSLLNHFEDFSKGVIDTGHVAYYILFCVFFIFMTLRVLDSNKWRG